MYLTGRDVTLLSQRSGFVLGAFFHVLKTFYVVMCGGGFDGVGVYVSVDFVLILFNNNVIGKREIWEGSLLCFVGAVCRSSHKTYGIHKLEIQSPIKTLVCICV